MPAEALLLAIISALCLIISLSATFSRSASTMIIILVKLQIISQFNARARIKRAYSLLFKFVGKVWQQTDKTRH